MDDSITLSSGTPYFFTKNLLRFSESGGWGKTFLYEPPRLYYNVGKAAAPSSCAAGASRYAVGLYSGVRLYDIQAEEGYDDKNCSL